MLTRGSARNNGEFDRDFGWGTRGRGAGELVFSGKRGGVGWDDCCGRVCGEMRGTRPFRLGRAAGRNSNNNNNNNKLLINLKGNRCTSLQHLNFTLIHMYKYDDPFPDFPFANSFHTSLTSFSTRKTSYAPPIIKISPVVSLVINKRSLLSQAKPVGRKQPLGQLPRLEFCMMLTAAVVLVDGSTGWPSLNAILESR